MPDILINLTELPDCPKCGKGKMLPFWDFGYSTTDSQGPIYLKGWACAGCGCNLFLSRGKLETQPFKGVTE